ncbi:MAG: hypothetical protein ACPGRD_03535 [Planktomarina sp.]
MLKKLTLFLTAMVLANSVFAQTAPNPAQTDLDGDDLAETILFLYPTAGTTHLLISPVNKPTVLAQDFVWRGTTGQEPTLSVAPNGDLRVTSGNQALGRDRWLLIQTIAFHQGAYRVTHATYNWFDTNDINNAGTCDVNFITGAGKRRLAGQGEQAYTVAPTAMVISDWKLDTIWKSQGTLPDICGTT